MEGDPVVMLFVGGMVEFTVIMANVVEVSLGQSRLIPPNSSRQHKMDASIHTRSPDLIKTCQSIPNIFIQPTLLFHHSANKRLNPSFPCPLSLSPLPKLSNSRQSSLLVFFKLYLNFAVVIKIKAMSNTSKIMQQFARLRLNENSNLTETQIKRALDQICHDNAKLPQFNHEVAEELWSEVEKNNDGTVTLRNYVELLARAQGILKENIQKCESELASPGIDPAREQELKESLLQYTDDLKLLSLPFQLTPPQESRYVRESKANMEASRASGGMDGSGLFSGRASGIFADVPSARENSVSLKLTFLLAVIMFVLELILMFHKDHFYNALVYVSIFAIVLLGYFDKYYIKWVLGNLVVSVVFDLLWVFLQSSPYWNPNPPTHHSTIQTPFLRFMYIFVIILMIAKVLLFLLFFRYRNNDENVRKSVSIFSNVFEINGRLSENNPVSRILSGQGMLASGYKP